MLAALDTKSASIAKPAEALVAIKAEIQLAFERSGSANSSQARTVQVHCVTGPNRWWIEDDWVRNGQRQTWFDGTYVYESLGFSGTDDALDSAGLAAQIHPTTNLWPSADGHPLSDEPVNLAWLAFCSGSFLSNKAHILPLPADILRHTPDRYAYTDRTEVFAAPPGLPRKIEWHLSRERYLRSIEDFYAGWGTRYLPWMRLNVTNLQEGALMCNFQVTATTNFNGLTFPLRFELHQEERKFIQAGNSVRNLIGTLKSIGPAQAP